jgi:predicted glycosyltransferase
MKIIFYCQHVLGIGHFMRSLALCHTLADHQVILVTGGANLRIALPPHVTEFPLPALMMDASFSGLYTAEPRQSIEAIKSERKRLLTELFRNETPDVFLVELYPFGRKQFRFELDPALKLMQSDIWTAPRPLIISSVRDILVEKDQRAKYESRVVQTLNSYFDALFIHADPAFVKLDETFGRMADIDISVHYTGYITSRPPAGARSRIRRQLGLDPQTKLIIASAGGGKVGFDLLEATAIACRQLSEHTSIHLIVFAGPYMEEAAFERLELFNSSRIQVLRFTQDFLSFLKAAELSISLAGYNTSMNLLATQTPALVWPFDQNREQRMRAERMTEVAPVAVLKTSDITSPRLQALIMNQLTSPNRCSRNTLDLDGAIHTNRLLTEMVASRA